MIVLGFWQLDRAEQKTVIKNAYDQRSQKVPLDLGEDLLDENSHQFFRVQVSGNYEPGYQVFEDNRIVDGRPGYYVFTPFRILETDTRILVNRGWIPWGESLLVAPEIETPVGTINLKGLLKTPTRGYYTLDDSSPTPEDRIWQNLDLDHYRSLHKVPFQPLVLLLSPDIDGGGFKRSWPTIADSWIARHQGYAVQWFAMAVVLVVIFLMATLKRNPATVAGTRE